MTSLKLEIYLDEGKPEFRRVSVTDYESFLAWLMKLTGRETNELRIEYIDNENDWVTFDSEGEYNELLEVSKIPIRIRVSLLSNGRVPFLNNREERRCGRKNKKKCCFMKKMKARCAERKRRCREKRANKCCWFKNRFCCQKKQCGEQPPPQQQQPNKCCPLSFLFGGMKCGGKKNCGRPWGGRGGGCRRRRRGRCGGGQGRKKCFFPFMKFWECHQQNNTSQQQQQPEQQEQPEQVMNDEDIKSCVGDQEEEEVEGEEDVEMISSSLTTTTTEEEDDDDDNQLIYPSVPEEEEVNEAVDFKKQLELLKNMGFGDTKLNTSLLHQNNGDVKKVVASLLK